MDVKKYYSSRVRASLVGCSAEDVLNEAIGKGMILSAVVRVDAVTIELTLKDADYSVLSAAAKKRQCELKRLEISGLDRSKRKLASRLSLFILLSATAIALSVSSLFVWRIDIEGNSELSEGEIRSALSLCGMDIGTYRIGSDPEMLRCRMLEALPKLAWITVRASGSEVRVTVLEREEKPEMSDSRNSLYISALTSGVIRKSTVMSGYSDIKPGDAVTEGDILVSGLVGSIANGYRTEAVKAEIYADTVRTVTGITPCLSRRKCVSGRTKRYFSLKIGKRILKIGSGTGKTIDGCDKIINEYKIGVEELFQLPISVISVKCRYSDLADTPVFVPGAEQRLYDYLNERINGEIVSFSVNADQCAEAVYYSVSAQCYENIAELREQ